jgi:hypothetical protein
VLSLIYPVELDLKRNTIAKATYTLSRDVGATGTFIVASKRLAQKRSPPTDLNITVAGNARKWGTITDGWIKASGEAVAEIREFFCDLDGDFQRDPGEESAWTSPGGEPRFIVDFRNVSEAAVAVTPILEGIPAEWFEAPEAFVLVSGESRRGTIAVRVPESAAVEGSYLLTLRAGTAVGTSMASRRLQVVEKPVIGALLPPDGIVTARTSVELSWRTSAETTGQVHVKNLETGADVSPAAAAEFSRVHRVELTGLEVGTLYEWWVESTGRWGGRAVAPSNADVPTTAVPRRFLAGSGVVFAAREYTVEVARDYEQILDLGIRNDSGEVWDAVLAETCATTWWEARVAFPSIPRAPSTSRKTPLPWAVSVSWTSAA